MLLRQWLLLTPGRCDSCGSGSGRLGLCRCSRFGGGLFRLWPEGWGCLQKSLRLGRIGSVSLTTPALSPAVAVAVAVAVGVAVAVVLLFLRNSHFCDLVQSPQNNRKNRCRLRSHIPLDFDELDIHKQLH